MTKRSAAKQSARPPELVFFVDRSLGRKDVPAALRALGFHCELHDDHFPPATEDAEWLQSVAARHWVVLTKDERIRYHPAEIAALRRSQARVFVVVSGRLTGVQIAAVLCQAMPRVLQTAIDNAGPFLFWIYKTGRLARAE